MDKKMAESSLVTLAKPRLQDLKFIRQLWADPDTMNPVGGPIYMSEQDALHWFASMIHPGNPKDCYRLIFDSEGNPVGEVSFHQLDTHTMTAELNLKILASARDCGYATCALHLFLDYFFNELGGRTLFDDVSTQNLIGQQFLLNFGFVEQKTSEPVKRFRMTARMFNQRT